jgi:uncharacterized protein involved in type VI secretion and phage assembly
MIATEASHFVVGVVSELDPQTAGRVRVRFPHLGMVESDWCPVVTPMGGPGRGLVFLPEKDDHVVLALEHGDTNRGFVLGAVWDVSQKPPAGAGKPAENNVRFVRSRSGHQVRLDDTKGKERIEVVDKDGARKVVIDTAAKKVQVVCDSGDVEVTAGSGAVSVKAGGAVTVEGATVTIKATGAMTVEAGGTLTLKGAMVNIN